MTIITVSRQFGCGAEEIVEKVCLSLGYHQFSKIQIIQAALEAGLPDEGIVDYSEDNHKVKNFFERLFRRSTQVAQVHVWKENAAGVRTIEEINIDDASALVLVQKAIKAACKEDNLVIVGRGGQIILHGYPDVLHVRIEANIEDRIQRVKNQIKEERQAYGLNVEMRREAQEIIREHDIASADYIRQYYNREWNDPTLYDLILNTSQISFERAVDTIVDRVHAIQLVHAR